MSRYNHGGPMDFQFENGTGPLDGRSPFAQLSQKQQQRFPPTPSNTNTHTNNSAGAGGKKRSYSAFDSPSKSAHTSPAKPLPPVPAAWNSLFSTPRKTGEMDDSSAGETPRSPGQDSDATPDHMHAQTSTHRNLRSALGRVEAASAPAIAGAERNGNSPAKERPRPEKRESWLGSQLMRVKNKVYSPGRGEIARPDHTSGMEKRVEKRRKREINRKEVSRRRRHSVSADEDGESEEEDDSYLPAARTSPRKISAGSGAHHHGQAPQQDPGVMPAGEHWTSTLWAFIARYPTVPHILSFYAQLFFNIFLLCCCAAAIWSAWSAFSADVDKKAHEAMADVLSEMAICATHYTTNRCERSSRVPAMETVCENWGKCMNQDPTRVGRAKVGATTFAEIFNSFVEPISWKTMGFTIVLVFGCFAISKFAFGVFRKTEGMGSFNPQQQQGWYGQQQQPPPPTPQRAFSGTQDGGFYAGGTPWQDQPVRMEPAPSGTFGQIEGRGSPVRRIQF